ncbi:NADH:flavin oxidoreductase/NADH oxidase [Dichomitus squalens]|uniref:NADH:flavin oxidoreductase/NADH oxidase n=2 Tax=Dichomitus squalens TaxID=114155 RepID=A0A4Q9NLD0_9APHY|nr:NADH:flavin oxidoreductase/NADH oxidase [Dichomitus squalens LYAD-421 SS1]EJF60200.1 NADH:flavin oxidoreductase/NADH oxidase [Dichomitus squalens LYAD-421 SS1]TBU40491.1 NADH:flavin oxidoreductase/NADH oxidase [Dichomitus squalens]TBU59997.1 NADH:flavin oxidoreductase/NADH oxidase [Dichomitus squalens]
MGSLDAIAPTSPLFQPAKVGDITTLHRVVLAPLTRCRANNRHAHTDLGRIYYEQRASVPGTLLIAEATYVSKNAGTFSPHAPGVYTEEQIEGWRRIAEAVHKRKSFIFIQLWALGRAALPSALEAEDPTLPFVAASPIKLSDRPKDEITPRALTVLEIKQYVRDFAEAARNTVHGAGCDGIELHAAHGYLIDQFIQDVSNKRTDEYGGSIENRCRFALEVVDAVSEAIGESKVGVRLSPWSTFQDMREENPVPTFTYLVSELVRRHPNLAYLHVVEPGLAGASDIDAREGESNDFLRKIWAPRPYIAAGRFTRESAMKLADETGDLIAFGRRFIPNPDLPLRLLKNQPLAPWERGKYQLPESPSGYIDYPFAEENLEELGVEQVKQYS